MPRLYAIAIRDGGEWRVQRFTAAMLDYEPPHPMSRPMIVRPMVYNYLADAEDAMANQYPYSLVPDEKMKVVELAVVGGL